jgi:hypothetical protein
MASGTGGGGVGDASGGCSGLPVTPATRRRGVPVAVGSDGARAVGMASSTGDGATDGTADGRADRDGRRGGGEAVRWGGINRGGAGYWGRTASGGLFQVMALVTLTVGESWPWGCGRLVSQKNLPGKIAAVCLRHGVAGGPVEKENTE